MDTDRILGALLGAAVGDALGMPVDGLSHQNVRTYYKGIKAYRADEHRRDLAAGQWTVHTQRSAGLVRALTASRDPESLPERYAAELATLSDVRRGSSTSTKAGCGAATAAAALGVWWAATDQTRARAFDVVTEVLAVTHPHPAALAAGYGQAYAVRTALAHTPNTLDGPAFLREVTDMTTWAEAQLGGASPSPAARLRRLADHLDAFPLDLQDVCNGTGDVADEAWPFAIAMFARNPKLLEATILPAINVGGAAAVVGACVGALVGALHGWAAFPEAWQDGLEDVDRLEDEAVRFAESFA